MIEITQVHKQFRRPSRRSWLARSAPVQTIYAVNGLSMKAADGRITGLLGPNGAGKTTTLRMLGGLVTPDSGDITVDGIPVVGRNLRALERLGMMGDADSLYLRLSARENIVYYGMLRGMARDQAEARAEELATTLDLRSLLDRRTEGFSQGERMKVTLARALVDDPPNIVLDEPTNGLDVVSTRALRGVLRWLAGPDGGRRCIVLSTHVMQEVELLCDEVVVVSGGRNVAQGSVPALLELADCQRFEDAFVHLAFDCAAEAL